MKKVLAVVLALLLAASIACAAVFAVQKADLEQQLNVSRQKADSLSAELAAKKALDDQKDIVVLFTSDVHCGLEKGWGYEGLAAIKAILAQENHVVLVDNGDSIQGEAVGSMTKGAAILALMNEVGYDVATMGNHEFDYGMETFLALAEKAEFPYISANFTYQDELVFAPYVIKEMGEKKVAFVGVTTPKTFTSSTPTYFQDENGNYVYGFHEDDTGEKLYAAVQKAADDARKEGADCVIVMSHLGIEEECRPWTSSDLILNTTGIDVLLDGHSHSVMENETVKNKDGKAVLMAACGTKLANVGYLKITPDGKMTTGLYEYSDAMATAVANATADLKAKLEEVVARTAVDLIALDPETGAKIIRNTETNLGHLVADAYRDQTGADIAMVNGGGIRANIPAGDVTLGQLVDCHPFGNSLCMKETTGQQILDALEWGARTVPGMAGGFQHVSGLSYEIHTYLPSTCTNDDKNNFTGVTGEYRVQNVMVNGEPLELDKIYTVASHNYLLKDGGDGAGMFVKDKLLLDEIKLDYQTVIDYIIETLNGVVGEEYAEIYPVERIVIVTEPAQETEVPAA